MGSYRRSTLRMTRLLLAASLVAGALGKTCDTLPNRKTNSTLDAKDRISSFFSSKHCLAVDAEMDSADLHGQGNHNRANAKVYWADCSAVNDDSKTAFAMTNKDGKAVQVVAAEFEHTTVKKGKMSRTGFTMILLKGAHTQGNQSYPGYLRSEAARKSVTQRVYEIFLPCSGVLIKYFWL